MSTYPDDPLWAFKSALVRSRGVCDECGGRFPRAQLNAHHVRPRGVGGSDAVWNLASICDGCHPKVEKRAQREAMIEAFAARVRGVPPRSALEAAMRKARTAPPPVRPLGLAALLRERRG